MLNKKGHFNLKIIGNPHFWVIFGLTLGLFFIYQTWPFREWQYTKGIWTWFSWLTSLDGVVLLEMSTRIIGILFFVPIIYAAVVFSWKGALIIYLASCAAILPIVIGMWSFGDILTNLTQLVLPLFITSMIAIELAWRRRDKMTFIEREAERQAYISKVLESQETERQRISHELHDDTIQTILSIANQAHKISSHNTQDETSNKDVIWIRDTALQTIEGLRRTILDLRPRIIDELGLVPALRWLLGHMEKETCINTNLEIRGEEYELTPQSEVIIFRVVQEALHNIKRHAEAVTATVTLEYTSDSLNIEIKDDGRGFQVPEIPENLATRGKFGIIGMHQRLQLLNASLKIRSQPGTGTSVYAKISRATIIAT